MVISRAREDAPRTFAGIPATFVRDTQYQEGFLTRANPNIPIQVTGQIVTRTRTGVSQPGLQQYTEP
jgi:hypothetical protein